MKNIIKIIGVALLVTAFTQKAKAQVKFSAGLELGLGLETGYGLMYGASVGGEYGIGSDDNMGITAQLGYIFAPVDIDFYDKVSSSFIPLQFGYKYYFDSSTSGAYVHGQLGIHIYRFSYEYEYETFDYVYNPTTFTYDIQTETVKEEFSNSDSNLSYAVGGGYILNENIDLGLRYNIVSATGGSFNYLGVRAAYNF
jgi:hypothetical protein